MTGSINNMYPPNGKVEDRIFQLLGEQKTPFEIVRVLGLDQYEGCKLVWKVIDERGTPNANALRASIERGAAIRI